MSICMLKSILFNPTNKTFLLFFSSRYRTLPLSTFPYISILRGSPCLWLTKVMRGECHQCSVALTPCTQLRAPIRTFRGNRGLCQGSVTMSPRLVRCFPPTILHPICQPIQVWQEELKRFTEEQSSQCPSAHIKDYVNPRLEPDVAWVKRVRGNR